MGRLAIFVDGGYIDRVSWDEFGVRTDYGKLATALVAEIDARSVEPVELLRTFFYHCLPYQSVSPTAEEAKRFSSAQAFMTALRRLPRFDVRLGRLAPRGFDANGVPIFQQKRVDLLLGLDFALLAGKHRISHAALVSGDSDLVPAVETAKQEGVCVWLVHGPPRSKADRTSTYARELWDAADERIELTHPFMQACSR